MACTMCASAAVGLSGCGCDDNTSSNSSKPGYKVEPTEPDLTNGDFGFFIINQEELMITKYTGSDTVIEIPESYKNYKVTVIGASVFNNSKITEVTIPSSIKQIEDYAFSSCHSLTKVNLSEGLEILNNSVFFNCSELREIKLPSTLKEIGPRAFSGAALNNVVLPDSGKLTKIDEYAGMTDAKILSLQPCDVKDEVKNRQNLKGAIDYCLRHPEWHLSLQTHKIIDVR